MKNKILKTLTSWSVPFCILACITMFIFKVFTSEGDASKRWCSNCNVFHDVNDQTIEETWCNNCNTWHAPKDESNSQIIQ